MAGMGVSPMVLRAKGGGMTPWEQGCSKEADQNTDNRLKRQITRCSYGIGGYNQTDLLG